MEIKKVDNGFVVTNENGQLKLSWGDFWEICRVGRKIDTKGEVEEYLSDCEDIRGHDLDRIRAFPELVDKITDKVIDVRIGEEKGDQIYDAAVECIRSHIVKIEDNVKWFRLSEDKCISIWYAPDKYDGDQFQMHLEKVGEDGYMGAGCEVLSDESYATNDISFKSLCETLSEFCFDADVEEENMEGYSGNVEGLAKDIFKSYDMELAAVELINQAIECDVLHRGENGGVLVCKTFHGFEAWEEVPIDAAARDLVEQGQVDMLREAIDAKSDAAKFTKKLDEMINDANAQKTNCQGDFCFNNLDEMTKDNYGKRVCKDDKCTHQNKNDGLEF